jgi:predicted nucleotidyltransferase
MEKLSEQTEQLLKTFAQELVERCGERLHTVILYGSAVGVEYLPEVSDLNVLAVFERAEPQTLQAAQSVLKRYRNLPLDLLCLTEGQLVHLPRVYPIEAWDLKEERRVLYGADIAADWEIDPHDLSRQLLSELYGKVISLRSLYLDMWQSAKIRRLEEVLGELIAPYRALLRALLRLLGQQPPPREFLEIIGQLEEVYGFNLDGFRDIYQIRLRTKRLLRGEMLTLLEKVLQEAEALAERAPQLLKVTN